MPVFTKHYAPQNMRAPNNCLEIIPNLQRAINQNHEICSKLNQVICSSSPISWPSFKPLAQTVFSKSCKFEMPKFENCHNSVKKLRNLFKRLSDNLLIIPYQRTKFQVPTSNNFREILLTSLKCPNLQRTITPKNFDGIGSKVNQVIYLSFPVSWLIMTIFQT